MSDLISAVMLYGEFPHTMADLKARLADLSFYSGPQDADNIESTTQAFIVTADADYPHAVVQNWWQAFIGKLQEYGGLGSRSLVERRLLRIQWTGPPQLGRRRDAFAVRAEFKLIKLRDQPRAEPEADDAA